jgi:hypothetical protein
MRISVRRFLLVSFFITILALVPYLYLIDPGPTWDHSSEKVIIHTSPGAMHIDYNYIPDLQIWGNGRIVWVEHREDGSRVVKEGFLSEEELKSILIEAIDTGIFKPFRHFLRKQGQCQYPGMDNEFRINLTRERAVEPIRIAEHQLCQFVFSLSEGAGIDGTLFQPNLGWLHVLPIEKTDMSVNTNAVDSWPDSTFPFDLQMAYEEGGLVEISGKVLELSWSIVNSSRFPVVLSRGSKYWIAVRVPELSTF